MLGVVQTANVSGVVASLLDRGSCNSPLAGNPARDLPLALSHLLKRLEHLPGFWCCRKVLEGEDGGAHTDSVPAGANLTFMLAT